MSHEPKRSPAQKTTWTESFRGFSKTSYTDTAKAGRTYGRSESGPVGRGGRPTGRSK